MAESPYFRREAGSILHVFHAPASKSAAFPRNPPLQWANRAHENGEGDIPAAEHQNPDLNVGRGKNKCSVNPNLQQCDTTKQQAFLTQVLVRDEVAFVLLLFPGPVSRRQLKLTAVLIGQKRGT